MTPEQYARRVIGLYLSLPGVTGRAGPADWTLARALQAEGVAFDLIEAALLLATARRAAHDPAVPPLPPIRSLAYFRPVIAELKRQPPPRFYLDYLREGVALLRPTLPARVRKTAVLDDR